MKLVHTALGTAVAIAIATAAATPALAVTRVIDFDTVTSFASVAQYYDGGTDSAGALGASYGVSFGADALALANDALGPYFTNAPSSLGVMTAVGSDASLNVAAGFTGSLSFYYSSSALVISAVNVYSGLNGTGSLLASFNLVGNATADGCSSSAFCRFDQLTSSFAGTAHSISFGNAANLAVFDNIGLNVTSAVPEASTSLLMALGMLGMVGFVSRRRG